MIISYFIKYWKPILLLTLLSGSYVSGYYHASSVSKPMSSQTKSDAKRESKKITRIEEKKDGSKTTIITETKKESKKVKEKIKTPTVSKMTHYRLGVGVSINYESLLNEYDYSANTSMRLYNSPFWLDASYQFKKKELTLGVSYEF